MKKLNHSDQPRERKICICRFDFAKILSAIAALLAIMEKTLVISSFVLNNTPTSVLLVWILTAARLFFR